jgi:hypothetical protein
LRHCPRAIVSIFRIALKEIFVASFPSYFMEETMISKMMNATVNASCATFGCALRVAGLPFAVMNSAFKTARHVNDRAFSYWNTPLASQQQARLVTRLNEPGWGFVEFDRK